MTFSEFMDWGLFQEVMKAKKSYSDDISRARRLKDYFGQIKASQVTPLMVENFRIKVAKTVSEKTGRPYSGTTVNRMIALARRIYNLGMDAGILQKNPYSRRAKFKEHPLGKFIPDEKFQAIAKELPEDIRPLVITAYLTGMRRGEIVGLEWSRVDLDSGTIDLSAEDTKTDEPRIIYLGSLPELRRVFIEAKLKRKLKQKLVFLRADGREVQGWTVSRLFKKACQKAGVGSYRLHDCRHTFTTNCVKAGVSKATIMKLTGHKTLSMFLRYSHLDREQSESAMNSLGELLSEKRKRAHG